MPRVAGRFLGTERHSYPTSPGTFCSGAILTTSSIVALQRGHAIRRQRPPQQWVIVACREGILGELRPF
jgi:hypothetical protein